MIQFLLDTMEVEFSALALHVSGVMDISMLAFSFSNAEYSLIFIFMNNTNDDPGNFIVA